MSKSPITLSSAKPPKTAKTLPWLAAAVAFGVITGVGTLALGQLQRQANDEAFSTPEGRAFLETYNALRDQYLKEVKPETLMRGALAGMIESLNDEFTYYVSPVERNMQQDTIRGEFFGVGATLNPRNRGKGTGAVVESVVPGSPALAAGVRAGDIIDKVDGKSINELVLSDAVQKIRGPKGSTVTLTVLRGTNAVQFKIKRDRIVIPSVSTTTLTGNVGYIALGDFLNQNNVETISKAIREFQAKKVKGIVLDLRNNGGGFVAQAEEISDLFLGKGDIFVTRGRDNKVDVEYSARNEASDYTGPLVVLVNQFSASASEIVSSSLQENGRAKVVGEKTFGKGVANIPVRLANGGQVNVATEEWLTPKRNSLLKKGVTPDIIVADSRFPKRLSVTLTVNGKKVTLKADKDGKFSYFDDGELVKTNDRQGNAIVDIKTDAQLRRALVVLGVQAGR
jgi:carboxyl-terminal processing protease